MEEIYDERLKIFKSQDPESGFFDVTFEVEGKLIYAHKFMLVTVSAPIKAMLSNRWNKNKEEIIPISAHTYANFLEFVTFTYSGICKLNGANIFGMVDIAEFYQVKILQQKCDQYLSEKQYTSENALKFFYSFSKYFNSLPLFETVILSAIAKYSHKIAESENFVTSSKENVKNMVTSPKRFIAEEALFQMIYEWAEFQAVVKQEASDDDNFNLNETIKSEIIEFLPYIQFKKMDLGFLHRYVVKRGFIFSYDELSDILEKENPNSKARVSNSIDYSRIRYANTSYKVKVTNLRGQSIVGFLPHGFDDTVRIIKTLRNRPSDNIADHIIYWKTSCKFPSSPSTIHKRDGVEWYLTHFSSGNIGILPAEKVYLKNYLLAEMIPENTGFEITSKCKIEI